MGKAYNDEEIENMIKNIDSNNNGCIDYSGRLFILLTFNHNEEFVSATIHRMHLLSEAKLEAAFKLFDAVKNLIVFSTNFIKEQ